MWKFVAIVVLLLVSCAIVQCNGKKGKVLRDSEGKKKKG